VVLHRGRIVQRGTHAELMQEDGLYRRLASYQFRKPSGTQEGLVS
jgi:subfamily B ATP-binding cassette protein MsbA